MGTSYGQHAGKATSLLLVSLMLLTEAACVVLPHSDSLPDRSRRGTAAPTSPKTKVGNRLATRGLNGGGAVGSAVGLYHKEHLGPTPTDPKTKVGSITSPHGGPTPTDPETKVGSIIPPHGGLRGGGAAAQKQLVVVCNAYADARPAFVGVLSSKDTREDALQAVERLQGILPSASTTAEKDSLWRSIGYGTCEEYRTDFTHRRLFFMPPGNGSAECDFNPTPAAHISELAAFSQLPQQKNNHLGPLINGNFARLVVVLTQPVAVSTRCVASPVVLPTAHGDAMTAEIVVVDAFARKSPVDEGIEEEELEMEEHDKELGLSPLPPLDIGSVIRLEDKIESWAIASEVVASRTLNPGQVYNVEPKEVHVVLEDVRGSHAFDFQDVNFESGHTYVGMRIGRADDTAAFPQKLSFYPCQYTEQK